MKLVEDTNIKTTAIFGIGDAGTTFIEKLIPYQLDVARVAINTDEASLAKTTAIRVPIGTSLLHGKGTMAKADNGRSAALHSVGRLQKLVARYDTIYMVSGMGGGTGSGATPVIAQIAKRQKKRCIAVITEPFLFEGKRRREQAHLAIDEIYQEVDMCVVCPQQNLISELPENTSLKSSFGYVDTRLTEIVRTLVDFQHKEAFTGLIQNVMYARAGKGTGEDEHCARDAICRAAYAESTDFMMNDGVEAALVHVTASSSQEQSVARCLATIFPKTAHVLYHFVADDNMGQRAEATVVVAISKKTLEKRTPVVPQAKEIVPPKLTVAGGSRHHGTGGIFTTDRLEPRPWMTQKPTPKGEVQKQQEGTDEHPK